MTTPETFGNICPANQRGCDIAIDVYRYLLDETGNQTGYIRRVAGRPVQDIAADLSAALRETHNDDYEWATLGQCYKYGEGTKLGVNPMTECPDGNPIVYVTPGGSEGHLVHVDVKINKPGVVHAECSCIFMVKTLSGRDAAKRIEERLASLLGVL